jgi:peroxiredoxin
MTKPIRFMTLMLLCCGVSLIPQQTDIRPVGIEQPMPDFSLPVLQGGTFSLSELRGKNVMLIFPRGLAGPDHWCHVCNYQYAELVELERTEDIREKLNLEIVWVLPYARSMVQEWLDVFPQQLNDIEAWKNPPESETLDERARRRRDMLKRFFPKQYTYKKGAVPTPFPILVDGERAVSQGLGLFAEEWGGSKIEQNIPTIFILDPEGVVRFKYMSQNTFDRPSAEYLRRFLQRFIRE